MKTPDRKNKFDKKKVHISTSWGVWTEEISGRRGLARVTLQGGFVVIWLLRVQSKVGEVAFGCNVSSFGILCQMQ